MEHADEYPDAIVEQMKELGLFGITIPEEYGGLGLDLLTYIGVVEELAYGWMSLSGIVNTHTIAAHLIVQPRHRGAEAALAAAARDRRAPRLPLALGGRRRQRHAQHLVPGRCATATSTSITGTKMWVTNGERAGIVALAARTDEGISCFIVEKEPGPDSSAASRSAENIGKLGYKGIETVEMSYDDHRVPADALLGDPGRGLGYILGALEVGRINIAARAVGVARAAFDAALAVRAGARARSASRSREHQAIQMKLADMATQARGRPPAHRSSAAERKQAGERADVEAGMAKLFASETAFEIATEALRIHGGVGYTTELPVERYYRDAPLMIIGEGTNEIQRLVIARGLLARAPKRTR